MLNKSHKKTRRLRQIICGGLLSFALVSLAACGTIKVPASVAGLCNVIPKAEYAVLGKTQYDQDFVDAAVVAGDSCGYDAPKPRPPELDNPRVLTVPPAPARKPTLRERLRAKISRAPGRVDPAPARIVLPASLPQVGQPLPSPDPPPVVQPAKPVERSPVERLLDPDGRRS